jgi:hypothetical protein
VEIEWSPIERVDAVQQCSIVGVTKFFSFVQRASSLNPALQARESLPVGAPAGIGVKPILNLVRRPNAYWTAWGRQAIERSPNDAGVPNRSAVLKILETKSRCGPAL